MTPSSPIGREIFQKSSQRPDCPASDWFRHTGPTVNDRPPNPVSATTAAVPVASIDVMLLDLPLRESMVAAHGRTDRRPITIVRVTTADGVVGWGECSALPSATYTGESAVDSFHAICRELAPAIVGRPMASSDVAPLLAVGQRPRPMAISALEMAVLDAELRAADSSLAAWLGVDSLTVPAGVSVGLAPVAETVSRVDQLVSDGYRRVKLKVEPGHDRQLVAAVRAANPDIEIHVDANGAYAPGRIDPVLDLIAVGVDAVEQPFARGDEATAAELIVRLAADDTAVPVVADEAVQSPAEAESVLAAKAMTGLSIKPARVGGILAARLLHDRCWADGISATAGGMLETGLGRHALAALAALPGFDLTGDLSPAGRWLSQDPFPDLEMTDGFIQVHDQAGVAPDPDDRALAALTVEQRLIESP